METYVSLLQTYAGRDKIIRTTSYACMLLTGAVKGKAAKDLATIAKNISSTRTVLRLFDDIPMLFYTLQWSKSERDWLSKILSNLANLSILAYFPCEKIAWASDNEILPLHSAKWWTSGIALWALCLFFNLIKNFRQLAIIRHRRAKLQKQRKLESPDRSGDEAFKLQLAELGEQELVESLTVVKNLGDIMMAVNWLPAGFLWATKLSPLKTAFCGTVSSGVGLYLLARAHNKNKTKTQ